MNNSNKKTARELLAVMAERQKNMADDVKGMREDLDKMLDPEGGVYSQMKDLHHEVNNIKRTYKWVISGSVFVGFALRDIGVRILTKINGG